MPNIALKDATAAWKKAKPMTVTKTGISEELRKLEAFDLDENMAKWVAPLTTAKKVIEGFINNKHNEKEKKAQECLHFILAEINFQLNNIPKLRNQVNTCLKNIHNAGLKVLAVPSEQNLKPLTDLLKAYNQMFTPTANGHDFHGKSEVFVQVPTRIHATSERYVKAFAKKDPQLAHVKDELEKYLKAHPPHSI